MISRRNGDKVAAITPGPQRVGEEDRRVRQGDQHARRSSSRRTRRDSSSTAPRSSSQPRRAVDASGIAGMRINHNLNVHVDGFEA